MYSDGKNPLRTYFPNCPHVSLDDVRFSQIRPSIGLVIRNLGILIACPVHRKPGEEGLLRRGKTEGGKKGAEGGLWYIRKHRPNCRIEYLGNSFLGLPLPGTRTHLRRA